MKDETKLVTLGRDPERNFGVVNPAVYHASTLVRSSLEELHEAMRKREANEAFPFYGRVGNPTALAFESAIAALEGGFRSLCFPSGLAAVSSALLAFAKAGDHVLIADNVYGPTRTFADNVLARFGVTVSYFDPLIGAEIETLMDARTRIVFFESPGSLTFEVADVPAIAAASHARGAIVIMDNTWATPLYFKPLAHGVDVSIQAATKYVVGHSDAMMGIVTTTTETHFRTLSETTYQMGQCAGPDDIYLAQRGLRTLGVRLARHAESALEIAEWLAARDDVKALHYPPLPADPGHELWRRDFSGASGLLSFLIGPCSNGALAAMLDHMALFSMGASWGGYESLILPVNPNRFRTVKRYRSDGRLLRIHVGLEDPGDLIADLDAGFKRLNAAT